MKEDLLQNSSEGIELEAPAQRELIYHLLEINLKSGFPCNNLVCQTLAPTNNTHSSHICSVINLFS